VRSKADVSQLNLPHGNSINTNQNNKVEQTNTTEPRVKLYVIIIHKFGHCSSLIVVIFFVFSLDLNLDLLLYNPAWLSSFMCPDICVVVELSVSKH